MGDRGFVMVDCAACGRPGVWLQCNACAERADFHLEGSAIRCACGSSYDHATCLCGAVVPIERLAWVAFGDGPVALADLEVDWRRVGALAGGAILALAALGWWWTG